MDNNWIFDVIPSGGKEFFVPYVTEVSDIGVRTRRLSILSHQLRASPVDGWSTPLAVYRSMDLPIKLITNPIKLTLKRRPSAVWHCRSSTCIEERVDIDAGGHHHLLIRTKPDDVFTSDDIMRKNNSKLANTSADYWRLTEPIEDASRCDIGADKADLVQAMKSLPWKLLTDDGAMSVANALTWSLTGTSFCGSNCQKIIDYIFDPMPDHLASISTSDDDVTTTMANAFRLMELELYRSRKRKRRRKQY